MTPRTNLPQRVLMTQSEVAQYLGVTTRTVRTYVATGKLRAYRLNRKLVRFDAAEVEMLLQPIATGGAA